MLRILLFALTLAVCAQSLLSPEEQRGRQVYELGTSSSGAAIEATIAGGGRVPGSIMPCANCHGRDGAGKSEGGVTPSNLTWNALTKPYGVTHADGRTHPPYTEHFLKRAITAGFDPGGNALNPAMPRFQLSITDAADLVAYIKRLGDAIDPGVTVTAVRIGVILQQSSENAPAGRALRQALVDYFESANAAGGVFNRRIELAFSSLAHDPGQRSSALREFLRDRQPFAVLGDFTGAEAEIASVLRETGTPAIATLAPLPEPGLPFNAYVFYLDGGLKDEMDSLIRLAEERYPGNDLAVAIVAADNEISEQAAKWLRARLSESGRRSVTMSKGSEPVDADLLFCLRPLAELRVKPGAVVLVPGSLAGPSRLLPSTRVFVAVSKTETESEPMLRSIWNRATASAALMVEAMRIAGRGLSRSALIGALEGFREVRTNLGIPVSFGAARRTGANGAAIMTIDSQSGRLVPAGNVDAK